MQSTTQPIPQQPSGNGAVKAAPDRPCPGTAFPCGLFRRIGVALGLICDLRKHDFRAAATFMRTRFANDCWPTRLFKFVRWSWRQMFSAIPDALTTVSFAECVSRTPIWLAQGNPLANHPWRDRPDASLPEEAEVVVIGAGFTGAGCAYHWSKSNGGRMVVLEMNDPASGASGRNEGLVVMGRYYAMVYGTVLNHLGRVRKDLVERQRDMLARKFAAAYCRAAYKNADMIEQIVKTEGFDCDYARTGWIQARDADQQDNLERSVETALVSGFTDWTKLTPEQVREKCGMRVEHNAGFSVAAASFHPAKWVWSLLNAALRKPEVRLFARTKVLRIDDAGDHYLVHTSRGAIRARHVVNATESFTPLLHRQFHDIIQPTQTQAAFGDDGPASMKPNIGISGPWFFGGRHGRGVMVGSDATRVPDSEADCNQPSRFLTKFLCGELKRYFGTYHWRLTHEWSGCVGYTPDEFPIVGLIDGKRQYIIGGMCGSGTAVSFNGARHVVQQILGLEGPDDYPAEYFAPTRLLDPNNHRWPALED